MRGFCSTSMRYRSGNVEKVVGASECRSRAKRLPIGRRARRVVRPNLETIVGLTGILRYLSTESRLSDSESTSSWCQVVVLVWLWDVDGLMLGGERRRLVKT